MTETVASKFDTLVAGSHLELARDVVRRRPDDEDDEIVSVTFVSDQGVANASLWTRRGEADFEVIDEAWDQILFIHLERPTPDQVERAWNEMIGAYLALAPTA